MAELIWDSADFEGRSSELAARILAGSKAGKLAIGNELLRLSRREVPFDQGDLSGSGKVEPEGEDVLVGYNKVYAAYQHEGHRHDGSHVIHDYKNGRKGHYLSDPMKENKEIFERFYFQTIEEALKG